MMLIAGTVVAYWKQQCGLYAMNCSHGRIERNTADVFLGMSRSFRHKLRQPDDIRFQPLAAGGSRVIQSLVLELKEELRTIQEDTVFQRWRSSHCSIATRVLFAPISSSSSRQHVTREIGNGPIRPDGFEAIQPSNVLGKPQPTAAPTSAAVLKKYCKTTNAISNCIAEIAINDRTHLEDLYSKTADEIIRMMTLKPTTEIQKLHTDREFANEQDLDIEERFKAKSNIKFLSDDMIPPLSDLNPTKTVTALRQSQQSCISMQARTCADFQTDPPRVLIDCWVSSQSKQQQQLPIVSFDIILYHKPTLHVVTNHEELEPIMRSMGWMPWDSFEGFKEYVKLPPQGKPFPSPVEIVKLPSPLQFRSLQDFHMVQSLVLAHSSIFDVFLAFHFSH